MLRTTPEDPSPLTPEQASALLTSATRQLTWGLRATAAEVRRWRRFAEQIPAATLRDDALDALATKRGHLDGAALCAILPRRRNGDLIRAVVAYQTILDFLDNVSERHPSQANGQQLHRALVEAVDPHGPISDYYLFHPWADDGGYLVALVQECRRSCLALPAFERIRETVIREARLSEVLGLNHEIDPARRDAGLRRWAAETFPRNAELRWFELTAAASASLLVHVLIALASDPALTDREVRAVREAHWPWIALAATMLDSYADWADDLANGDHSYVAHYGSAETAAARIALSTLTGMRRATELPNGARHAVIVACMAALYLSKPSARRQPLRATSRDIARSGGSLVGLLVPILRTWRLAYGQRD